jgi:hypothetical protein
MVSYVFLRKCLFICLANLDLKHFNRQRDMIALVVYFFTFCLSKNRVKNLAIRGVGGLEYLSIRLDLALLQSLYFQEKQYIFILMIGILFYHCIR